MGSVVSDDIAELSTIISENTQKVVDHLHSRQLPLPSFSVDAPTKSMIASEDEEIQVARFKVINATQKLQALMLGPQDFLHGFHVRPTSEEYLVQLLRVALEG